jgi:hypothetical protein
VIAALPFICYAICANASNNPIAEGDQAYQQGDYLKATEWYRNGANDDRWPELQAAAQDRLGRMFSRGDGVTQNGAEAIRWFEKSAALGNGEAPTDIGDIFFFARGVPRDVTKAALWYRKGADKGSLHGMAQLAWCYLNGMGVAKDIEAARDLYRRTAARGDDVSEYQYGWMFAHVPPIDYSEAMTWYMKAAAQNYSLAKNNIGYMYESGLGVKKNYATAAKWYEQAASAGERRGQYHLGLLYEQGLGVKKDLEKATALMRASALTGNEDATNWLATHHIGIAP